MPTAAMTIAHRLAGPPVRRLLRPRVDGLEHVPLHGGVLLAANHVSNLDNYLLSSVCPRPAWYLGKRELARGVFGAFNVATGMVPVDRGSGGRAAIDRLVALLGDGEVVAVFPEGTRSPTGELFRFRSGVARIACAADVPVVPVGLRGTAAVWPRGHGPRLHRPAAGALEVRFGPALEPPPEGGRPRRLWTATLRARVATLSGQPTADAFAPGPAGGRSSDELRGSEFRKTRGGPAPPGRDTGQEV
jgi:1-acyl-sn-glycerol-3-phosphate acyltransferase